jgi:hypothetical protein
MLSHQLEISMSGYSHNPKGGEGKKKKKYPHCEMEVYHKLEACFELEANAAKCPAGWKSKKSTWRCAEVKSTEQWWPGEVDITKLKKQFFPYLVAAGFDPPPYNELALSVVDSGFRPKATSVQRWAQRLKRRRVLCAFKQLEANAIEEAITQAMLDSGASKHFFNSGQGMQLTGTPNEVVVTADRK